MKRLLAMALLSPLIMGAQSGCGGGYEQATVVDTFCLTAKKRGWSTADTPESIADAMGWNNAIDRKCSGKPKPSA